MMPVVMTIAGSDSGGGAGIQADLRTFAALGVYGTSVITALTSQNPFCVSRVDAMDPAAVIAQMESVLSVFPIHFFKSGMLCNARIAMAAAERLCRTDAVYVADPVMISTGGSPLIDPADVDSVCRVLFPRADWITPNLHEAEMLSGMRVMDELSAITAARFISERFSCSVILKGGHRCETAASDLVIDEGRCWRVSSPRIEVSSVTTHGTGCTLSAAFTAGLALSGDWQKAIVLAKAFVLGSLSAPALLTSTLQQMVPPKNLPLDKITLEEI